MSDSPASILFNIDGYAVGALFEGDFIPFDNVGLLIGGKDEDGYFRYLSTSPTGSIKVTQATGRAAQAKYFAATSLITGAVAAQNLLTLENPSGSGINIYINRIAVGGVIASNSTIVFTYDVLRTSGLPTGGTTLSLATIDSSNPAATAVIRQEPTATGTGGLFWTISPGLVSNKGSMSTNNFEAFRPMEEDSEIILAPGEGLLVMANANSTDWYHWVSILWSEAE